MLEESATNNSRSPGSTQALLREDGALPPALRRVAFLSSFTRALPLPPGEPGSRPGARACACVCVCAGSGAGGGDQVISSVMVASSPLRALS